MSPVLARFVKYQGVSFVAFLADLAALTALLFVFNVNYLLATGIGFMLSVFVAFFLNRAWSFKKWVHTGRIAVSLFVGVTTLAAVLAVTYIGVQTIHVPYLEARAAAALIAAVVSYIGDSLFTFQVEPFE